MMRGLVNPVANCSTLKPGEAFGHAFSGRATTFGPLVADSVAKGSGKSFIVIWRIVPGSFEPVIGEWRLWRQARSTAGADVAQPQVARSALAPEVRYSATLYM